MLFQMIFRAALPALHGIPPDLEKGAGFIDSVNEQPAWIRILKTRFDKINDFLSSHGLFEWIGFAVVLYQITVSAWVCDDAFHGLQMVRNLVEHHQFVYVLGERVSVSTCPFHTLLIAGLYAIFGNAYLCAVISGILLSAAAVFLLFFKTCKGNTRRIIIFTLCMFYSRCFISYTTSGLENSMLFLLAGLFLYIYLKTDDDFGMKKLLLMALLVGIIAGTRMDAVLIFVPACIAVYFVGCFTKEKWIKRYIAGFVGLLPFILWLIFSVIYFGVPFPNTAYIKLNTGFPVSDYLYNGLRYVGCTFLFDPIMILTIAAYLVLVFVKAQKKHFLIAAGVIIYAVYIVRVGGDFMVGRHFTLMFYISLFGISDLLGSGVRIKENKVLKVMFNRYFFTAAALIAFSLLDEYAFYTRSPNVNITGVADERDYYFPSTSLKKYLSKTGGESGLRKYAYSGYVYELRETGGLVPFCGGYHIFYWGNDKKVLDSMGIGDALLARLPYDIEATRERYPDVKPWRIGHIVRIFPDGYNDTIKTGKNLIKNESLAEYYDKLSLVISGDIFSPERMKAVYELNTGKYDYLIEEYLSSLDDG